MKSEHNENANYLLHFKMLNVIACIEVKNIRLITLLPQLSIVPNGFYSLLGLMNLADESVPVIDLAIHLNLKKNQKYAIDNPIIVCTYQGKSLGLIVDHILELIKCNDLPKTNDQNTLYKASIPYMDEFSLLIDVEKIFISANSLDKI